MMSRLKVSRLTGAFVAACWMMSAGAASGQGLPASVSEPYARYQTAQAAGDTQAAEQAAGEAYRAARAEGLDLNTIGVLAEIYGYLARQNGDGETGAEILTEAAQIADSVEAPAGDRLWRWSLAAFSVRDLGQTETALNYSSHALAAGSDLDAPDNEARDLIAQMRYLRIRLLRASGEMSALGEEVGPAIESYQVAGWPLDARYAVTYSHGAAAAFQFEAYEDAATAYLIASDLLFAEGADPAMVWNARAYSRLAELIAWAGDETALDERLAGDVIFQQMAEQHAAATAALECAEVWSRPDFVDAVLEERVSPAYPETVGSDEPQGFVLARFTVRADGSTDAVEIVSEIPGGLFAEAAMDAVSQWRFAPATLEGDPVDRPAMTELLSFMPGQTVGIQTDPFEGLGNIQISAPPPAEAPRGPR